MCTEIPTSSATAPDGEGSAQRVDLDRVADRGAAAVGIDVAEVGRCPARRGQRFGRLAALTPDSSMPARAAPSLFTAQPGSTAYTRSPSGPASCGRGRRWRWCRWAFATRTPDGLVHDADAPAVGVTVDVGTGLYTPVIRDAATSPVSDIADALAELRMKALRTTLREDDLTGMNLLVALNSPGVVMAQPIIPPGVTCALSLADVHEKVVLTPRAPRTRGRSPTWAWPTTTAWSTAPGRPRSCPRSGTR